MKPNKLTPGFNLMWESSRMMLPEHKTLIQKKKQEQKQKKKPLLDEQELELFSNRLCAAYLNNQAVRLELFDTYQNRHLDGRIAKIDRLYSRLKLQTASEQQWILFEDIVGLAMAD